MKRSPGNKLQPVWLCFSSTLVSMLALAMLAPRLGMAAQQVTTLLAQKPHQDSVRTIELLFVGDAMQHDDQLRAAKQTDGSYSYDSCFRYIRPLIEEADLAVVNLETTLPGRGYQGYPQFRTPDAYAEALQRAGFDVVVTANNHSCDAGKLGVERTLEVLERLGMPHTGTFKNAQQRAEKYPLLLDVNGLRLVMLNYTYGTNEIPPTAPNIVNYIDTNQIKKDLAVAHGLKPDVLLAVMHWGKEYQRQPEAKTRQLAKWLAQHGVHLIIGMHPHTVQPVEWLDVQYNGKPHRALVAYSLGNFVSAQRHTHTDGGLLLGIRLEYNYQTRQVSIAQAGWELLWVNRPEVAGKRQYELLPVGQVENGDIRPVWEDRGQSKCMAFAESQRTLLNASNAQDIPQMAGGKFLDRWIGWPKRRPQLASVPQATLLLSEPTPTITEVELPSVPVSPRLERLKAKWARQAARQAGG